MALHVCQNINEDFSVIIIILVYCTYLSKEYLPTVLTHF